ncbi:MAG: HlyD family efflux transporter periplasmic adaptor subunit [Burkholderiaceae bacterium]
MKRIFSPDAIDARKQQYVGNILLTVNSREYAFFWVVALVSITSALAALFLEVSRTVVVEGKLRPHLGSREIISGQDGLVATQMVRVGEKVILGQPLFTIVSDSAEQFSQNSRASISDNIQQRIASLERRSDSQRALHIAEKVATNDKIKACEEEIRSISSQIALSKQRGALRSASVMRYQQSAGFFSQAQIDQQVELELQQLQTSMELEHQKAVLVARLRTLESDVRLEIIRFRDNIEANGREISKAREDLITAVPHRKVTISAPVSGTVGSIQAEVGKSVASGSTLASLIPAHSPLVAELYLPSEAISAAKVDDIVGLRIDSFPYQSFGQFDARISSISLESTLIRSIGGAGSYFIVLATPSSQAATVNGQSREFMSGMTLRAVIPSDKRPLWKWIFRS